MTQLADPMSDRMDTFEIERALEAYAEATRIVASARVVRGVQERLRQEQARGGVSRAVLAVRAVARVLGGPTLVPSFGTAVRLPSLLALLLAVLTLGAAVGGAGAMLSNRTWDGPAVVGPELPGPRLPGLMFLVTDADQPMVPVPTEVPVPTPTPSVTVKVEAQRKPSDTRRGTDRRRAGDLRRARAAEERRALRMRWLIDLAQVDRCDIAGAGHGAQQPTRAAGAGRPPLAC